VRKKYKERRNMVHVSNAREAGLPVHKKKRMAGNDSSDRDERTTLKKKRQREAVRWMRPVRMEKKARNRGAGEVQRKPRKRKKNLLRSAQWGNSRGTPYGGP